MAKLNAIHCIGNFNLCGKTLGKGAFGVVEKAFHVKTKSLVALKLFDRLKNHENEQFVCAEVEILSGLKHTNIVRLIGICTTQTVFCVALEFINGSTLADTLEKCQKINEIEAKSIAGQLIGALAYLHQNGVIHRDLKLENVMIGGFRVVVVDFGLATKWRPGDEMLEHPGSLDFAAPEIFNADPFYGPSVDVWSFGVIMYSLLAGSLPFKTATLPIGRPDIKTIKRRINRGFGTQTHYEKLKFTSNSGISFIERCLEVDAKFRISANELLFHPWIRTENPQVSKIDSSGQKFDPLIHDQIMETVKKWLKTQDPCQNIENHILKRPYGTTAALYKLAELELYQNVQNQSSILKTPQRTESAKKAVRFNIDQEFAHKKIGDEHRVMKRSKKAKRFVLF